MSKVKMFINLIIEELNYKIIYNNKIIKKKIKNIVFVKRVLIMHQWLNVIINHVRFNGIIFHV